MLNIVTVIGARPQFVKAAVLSRLVRSPEWSGRISEFLVHTGQHYDANMSEVFFREMAIPEPDVNLNIGSGGHGAMTGAMLASLERLLLDRRPDLLLVYGDTNSTLAGALAASKLHIPVAHVEAGLRSFMMAMPEEQNRILTDRLSTFLFCPTRTAVENLQREGIPIEVPATPSPDHQAVAMVGDIMLDASLFYRDRMHNQGKILDGLSGPFCVMTLHRAENTDVPTRLSAIVRAINQYEAMPVIFPIHPRTRKAINDAGLAFAPHVRLIDPVGYLDMLALESRCAFMLTDSGGVQKEAYFFRKPCITLRDSTEWVELVETGWNRLANADEPSILAALADSYRTGEDVELYGNGEAGRAILALLLAKMGE